MGWLKFLPQIIQAITSIERLMKAKGSDKQDAAIEAVREALELTEAVTDRDLLNDPVVEQATRKVIDDIIVWRNLVATIQATRQAKA